MNKKILLGVAGLVLAALVGGGFWRSSVPKSTVEEVKTTASQSMSLVVELPSGDRKIDISGQMGKTVLAVMESSFVGEYVVKGEGENAFVISIGGIKVDEDKREFWELIVNGQQAQVGAGSYIIKAGDQIKWKIANY